MAFFADAGAAVFLIVALPVAAFRVAAFRVAAFRVAAFRVAACFGAAFRADIFFAAVLRTGAAVFPRLAFFPAAAFTFTPDFLMPAVFLEAAFFRAPLRRPTPLAMSFPLIVASDFHQIIDGLSPVVQEAATKLIADGLPVRATIPIADNAPVPESMRKPVISSLSWLAA